jgi:hypothetical protein
MRGYYSTRDHRARSSIDGNFAFFDVRFQITFTRTVPGTFAAKVPGTLFPKREARKVPGTFAAKVPAT